MFKALADPQRRLLLDRLNARNGQTLRELCAGLDTTRQAVSKHLAVLEAANLVTTVRRGREKWHYLNPAPITEIADRWIRRYDRARAHALADLKNALEDTVARPTFVHTSFIRTTPERLWAALTEPAFTRRYWQTHFETDWAPGLADDLARAAAPRSPTPARSCWRADPPRRLSYTWHTFTPEWAAAVGVDEELRATIAAERRSRVSFDLEPDGPLVKLTVVHDDFDEGSTVARDDQRRLAARRRRDQDPAGGGRLGRGGLRRAGHLGRAGRRRPRRPHHARRPRGLVDARRQRLARARRRADLPLRRPARPSCASSTSTRPGSWSGPASRARASPTGWAPASGSTCGRAPGGGSVLAFRHVGLIPELPCFTVCSPRWEHHLANLMKERVTA